MRSRPMVWDPTVLVLLLVLGYGLLFAVGVWLGINGYGHVVTVVCFTLGGLVQLSEEHRKELIAAFRDALRITDLGIRKAALHMGIDPSDLERMLNGMQRFDVWRIEMLPEETRRCFYYFRAQRLGLPAFVRSALSMAPAFDVKRSA